MLKVEGLKKTYGDTLVVNNLGFTVNRGEIFGIIGSNGAGKTTTLKMIAGLLNYDEGKIHLEDDDISQSLNKVKRKIAFISDNLNLYENLTGREYVSFIGQLYDIPKYDRENFLNELLPIMNLEKKIDDFIKTYSKGMKQKIALLGALIHKPKLLILDEPLTGLDPDSSFLIKEYFKTFIKNGNSIIFSTHILDVAERLCNRILIIHNGNLIASGTIEELNKMINEKGVTLEELYIKITKNNKLKGGEV